MKEEIGERKKERKRKNYHLAWFDMAQLSCCCCCFFCFYCSSRLIVPHLCVDGETNWISKEACSLSRIDPISRNKCETKYIIIGYYQHIYDVVSRNSNIQVLSQFWVFVTRQNSIFDVYKIYVIWKSSMLSQKNL